MSATRILKVGDANVVRFVPQYEVGGRWIEFFGFDSDSPYLHVRMFETEELAAAFLSGETATYHPGMVGCPVEIVMQTNPGRMRSIAKAYESMRAIG